MKDYSAVDGIIKQVRECVENAFNKGFKQGSNERYLQGFEEGKESAHIDEEFAYEKGLNAAWECAREISIMDNAKQFEMFNEHGIANILGVNTVQKAIAKIKEYEKRQKENDEIRVGDEVKLVDEFEIRDASTWVVTRITDNIIEGICADGASYNYLEKSELKKTGRHFPQLAELLKQMQEDKK